MPGTKLLALDQTAPHTNHGRARALYLGAPILGEAGNQPQEGTAVLAFSMSLNRKRAPSRSRPGWKKAPGWERGHRMEKPESRCFGEHTHVLETRVSSRAQSRVRFQTPLPTAFRDLAHYRKRAKGKSSTTTSIHPGGARVPHRACSKDFIGETPDWHSWREQNQSPVPLHLRTASQCGWLERAMSQRRWGRLLMGTDICLRVTKIKGGGKAACLY